MKGMRNSLFPGLSGIEMNSQEYTHIPTPIDGPLCLTGIIKIYDETTGRIQVVPDWDFKKSTTLYAWARYQGEPGIPTQDEAQPGQPVVLHRVGDFNTAGTGQPGGYELREKSQNKVSWVAFFFPKIPVVPVNIYCQGVFKKVAFKNHIEATIKSAKKKTPGKKWVDTGIKELVGWSVFSLPGFPFLPKRTDSKKILCLDDEIIKVDRQTSLTCDGGSKGKIYNIQVVSGRIGKDEDCLIYYAPGKLSNAPICCPKFPTGTPVPTPAPTVPPGPIPTAPVEPVIPRKKTGISVSSPGGGTPDTTPNPPDWATNNYNAWNYITLPAELGGGYIQHVDNKTPGGWTAYAQYTDANNKTFLFYDNTISNQYWLVDVVSGAETWWKCDAIADTWYNNQFTRVSGSGGSAAGTPTDDIGAYYLNSAFSAGGAYLLDGGGNHSWDFYQASPSLTVICRWSGYWEVRVSDAFGLAWQGVKSGTPLTPTGVYNRQYPTADGQTCTVTINS